jgi:enoyl-CoA hydratase
MSAVHFETDGPVAVVTIDRPDVRNAVDAPTATELAEVFRRFDADESLSVAVLAGANGTFCAGADLKAITSGRGNRVVEDGDGPLGISRMMLSKPTIAAVEGYAVAGGLELSIWCDLRVAATDAVFGVFCRRWGVPLMDGGTVRLARLIGHGHALDMILTGRPVSGEEAYRIGLADRLVPKGAALDNAIALARDIAKFPQVCMRSDRLSSYEQWNLGLEDALVNEYRRGMKVIQSGAMTGGLDTFTKTAGRHGSLRHAALGTPVLAPFPDGMQIAVFAMGACRGPERRFWQANGVYTTAVGYAASREAVRVVFDPGKTSYEALLASFWEGHDPTAAVEPAQRSAIYWSTEGQRRAAEASRDAYQRALSAAGKGAIATEIAPAPDFHLADEAEQQYLAKNPDEHAASSSTGVRYPKGPA